MEERRRFARIQVDLRLKFKSLARLEGLIEAHAADLSSGGMFIRTKNVKAVGTGVEIEFPIPGDEGCTVRGTVRSIRYDSGEPVGMGIEFEELPDPVRGLIHYLSNKDKYT